MNGAPLPGKSVGSVHLDVPAAPFSPQDFEEFEETLRGRIYRVFETKGMPAAFEPLTVPAGHHFVLGDNRDNANDSRYRGTVPEENTIGIADAICLSINPKGPLRTESIKMGL